MYKKNGYAGILGLLIVLVIGMMIYFIDMKAIFGPGRTYVQYQDRPQDHPWELENLIVEDSQIVPVPRKGQPELLEPLNITAFVYRDNAPRGSVSLRFQKDCRLNADWSTQYQYDKKKYQLQTKMKGNTVSSRVYRDANQNEDKTRLFFISKGSYTQTTQLTDTPPRTEQGTAYILGWLRPDDTAEGTITITTDQSWSAVYDFRTGTKKTAADK
jgi:hypothetical protein